LSEGIYGGNEESVTSNTSNKERSTRCGKVRIKFYRCIEFFLVDGGSCSYDNESIGDVEVLLRYKHVVRQWVPNEPPQLDTDFCFNERIYCITLSSIHGLGLFSMDGIKVKD
jgi:hypothetical protein